VSALLLTRRTASGLAERFVELNELLAKVIGFFLFGTLDDAP
jgi:hypothetical protein